MNFNNIFHSLLSDLFPSKFRTLHATHKSTFGKLSYRRKKKNHPKITHVLNVLHFSVYISVIKTYGKTFRMSFSCAKSVKSSETGYDILMYDTAKVNGTLCVSKITQLSLLHGWLLREKSTYVLKVQGPILTAERSVNDLEKLCAIYFNSSQKKWKKNVMGANYNVALNGRYFFFMNWRF